ncbi:MAG: hypothetical protein KDA61_18665, partial [Planctomycetales bacterium]|nr:hypothetical protein [Planctomycetales bacterium]
LGAVMYALLAGRPPFKARTVPEMLQLQRFADPEPVRRYAPDAPVQLEHLIGQLLSKDPEDRFPNVLVLARHMEAMRKALSRPAPDPTPHIPLGLGKSAVDSTSAGAPDATLAESESHLLPLETSDSYAYDAPTLAEEERKSASGVVSTGAGAKPSSLTSRYMTVDEDAVRRASSRPSDRWWHWAQLLGLTAAVAALGYAGWRMSRPDSADELYQRISAAAADGAENLRSVEGAMDEFSERFSQDARAMDVAEFQRELKLWRLEYQAHAKARFAAGKEPSLAAEIYAGALKLAETDRSAARSRLEGLLALFQEVSQPRVEATPVANSEGATNADSPWLILARRKLDEWERDAREKAEVQLPKIRERLAALEELGREHPAQARAGVQAVVDLYEGEAWAGEAVSRARELLDELP